MSISLPDIVSNISQDLLINVPTSKKAILNFYDVGFLITSGGILFYLSGGLLICLNLVIFETKFGDNTLVNFITLTYMIEPCIMFVYPVLIDPKIGCVGF